MTAKIVVAGSTGNLGTRIVSSLRAQGAGVVALVRTGTSDEKAAKLRALGAEVAAVDLSSSAAIAAACKGASVVVSSLQGLRDVIVDLQSTLLDGAIAAGVPRFIPSDFSTDFTKIPAGENRNFDLRSDFRARVDASAIAATSVLNGAFAEILTYNVPLLDLKKKTVGYWGDADWHIEFTTMDDTAAYTAAAALDQATPRDLRIASFQVSPRQLALAASTVLGTPFALVNMGTTDELRSFNERERAAHPEGEEEIFPRWQQSQYMHSMFTAHHDKLDNERYPTLTWTPLEALLTSLRR